MRLVFSCCLALFLPLVCSAQETTPAVTNMAGFDGLQAGSVVTMSIGEPAITTLTSSDSFITQGFLQPEILPCLDVEFTYYPNPAIKEITIETSGCPSNIASVRLLDLWGQVIASLVPHKENKVSLESFSQAVYLLQVDLTSGVTKTIKVVKVAP